MTDVAPYERREGETTTAWAAFIVYRDLGTSRSFRKVSKSLGKSTAILGRWAGQNDWSGRCAAWDSKIDNIRIGASLEGIEKMSRSVTEMRHNHLRIAGKMRRLAELVIDRHLKLANAEDEQSSTEFAVSLDDARKLQVDASKLERSCLGEPDCITEERIRMTVNDEREIFKTILTNPKALEGLDIMMGAFDEHDSDGGAD